MRDRERVVRKLSRARDAARARLLAQHRELARTRERNRAAAERRANAQGESDGGDDPTRRSTMPATDAGAARWSSVPERPPTREDTPTAPHRPRLYGRRLRRRAEGEE